MSRIVQRYTADEVTLYVGDTKIPLVGTVETDDSFTMRSIALPHYTGNRRERRKQRADYERRLRKRNAEYEAEAAAFRAEARVRRP